VGIAVSTPHRHDAYEAGRFLIDELKVRVPIWKKENWDDGETAWVHPAGDAMVAANPQTAGGGP
jgi:molybdopterin synthase catalytic subunit